MKGKSISIATIVVFVLGIVLVQTMFFNRNLDMVSERASENWGKAVIVDDSKSIEEIELVELPDYILILESFEETQKLFKTSKEGEILEEKNIDLGIVERSIKLYKNKDKAFISWTSFENGKRGVHLGEIDDELEIKTLELYNEYDKLSKISENSMLLSGKNTVAIYEVGEGIAIKETFSSADNYGAERYNDKYYISYYDNNNFEYKILVYKDKLKVEELSLGKVYYQSMITIKDINLYVNDNEINMFYELYSKGRFKRVDLFVYNQEEKIASKMKLFHQGERIKNLKKSGSGVFTGIKSHLKDGREVFYDAVEFKIKDGTIVDIIYINNTYKRTLEAKVDNQYCIYIDKQGDNHISLSLTKRGEDLNYNSYKRIEREKKTATFITIKGIANTFLNLFILGWAWIVPVLLLGGILFYVDGSINGKWRYVSFLSLICVSIFQQIHTTGGWLELAAGRLPEVYNMTNVLLVIGVTMILVLASSIGRYVHRKEAIPIASFAGKIFLQEILMLSIFVPYIWTLH